MGSPKRSFPANLEHILEWVKALPFGVRLSEKQQSLLRKLLIRMPQQIWEGTRHWQDTAERLTPVDELRWRTAKRSD